MIILTYFFLGFMVAFFGSITPSFLNLTVVKFSLKSGRKAALYLIGGFATILFLQANVGAYFSSILMKNSSYISTIQLVGAVILVLLSINFFRLHFNKRHLGMKRKIKKSRAYLHGLVMALLNMFAIPFYFTIVSLLIGLEYFDYTIYNGFIFSIGSTIGSFSMYAIYATVADKIEHKLTFVAGRMNFILGCLTGMIGVGNLVYLS